MAGPFFPRNHPAVGSVPRSVQSQAPGAGIAPARTGTRLMQQIRAARYGATGLGSGGYSTVARTPGAGTVPYRMSAPATNAATLRAIARSSTPRAGWAQGELERRRQAGLRSLDKRMGVERRFAEARIERLWNAGRMEEAAKVWERMNRLQSGFARLTGQATERQETPSEEGYDLLPWK